MAKKLADIKELVENSAAAFQSYLETNVDSEIIGVLNKLLKDTTVYIFSGVIRNFFLGIREIRDLDIVLSSEIDVEKYFKGFQIKKNSFGGYKMRKENFSLDIWVLEKSWAFQHQKTLNFEMDKSMPSTAFFNFSSIIFNLNEKTFYYTTDFLRFLQNKKIDVVYKPNFNYELCIVNSFYYSEKYHLKLSENLKSHITYLHGMNMGDFEKVQIKHFGAVLYSNSAIESKINMLIAGEPKLMPKMFISYKRHIPSTLFHDLKKRFEGIGMQLSIKRQNEEYHNFTGPELSDIILFIKDNIILAPALYDIIKACLIKLIKYISGKKKENGTANRISIRYEDKNHRNIELNISGDYPIDEIKIIVSDALKVLSTTEQENTFNDSKFVDNSNFNSRIEMNYNPKSKRWEVTDFGKIRKYWDDKRKEVERKYKE